MESDGFSFSFPPEVEIFSINRLTLEIVQRQMIAMSAKFTKKTSNLLLTGEQNQ
jgi:hypothetical protein